MLFSIEFIFVVIFFALPPVFSFPSDVRTPVKIEFSLQSLCLLLAAIMIFLSDKELREKMPPRKKRIPLPADFLLSFCLLALVSIFFQGINLLLLKKGISAAETAVQLPKNASETVKFLAAVFSSAFFEEVVYRFYLPEKGRTLTHGKYPLFWECFAALLFAGGHIYQGVLGFFNSLFSGIVLRRFFCAEKNILASSILHAFFNLCAVLVSKAT